jgi:hypothetical protein
MAKSKAQSHDDGPAEGYVRLIKTGADGGYLDYPAKNVDRLLSLEKRLGVENYILPASDGDSGSDENQRDMGETEK